MNLYLRTWRKRRSNRAAAVGWFGWLQGVAGPVIATALMIPLFDQIFLSFLDLSPKLWGAGVAAVVLRVGVTVLSMLALDVFTAVIRGPDRAVLTMLPIDAAQVVRYEIVRVAVERWWILPAFAALLAPIAVAGALDLWAIGMVVVIGAWAMGLCVSAAVHLLAIEVAESPSWAGLLDMVRGQNPRPQAAFLYAPGVVLLTCGLIIGQGAAAIPRIVAGDVASMLWLALPGGLAVVAWLQISRLALGSWFKGSAVLAEIDARYAALGDREEGLRVYLDWLVRFLPPRVGLYALKDLRHGWRARRSLISGAWLVGLGGFAAGWTESAVGVERAAIVAIGGVWLCAAVGVLMERDEPDFLKAWLPPGGAPRWAARVLVLALWVQPIVWLAAASVAFRQGIGPASAVFGLGLGCVVLAIPTAIACGRLGQHGLAVYAPIAIVSAALVATTTGAS